METLKYVLAVIFAVYIIVIIILTLLRFKQLLYEIRQDTEALQILKLKDSKHFLGIAESLEHEHSLYHLARYCVFPFYIDSENKKIQNALIRHDKFVVIFWRSVVLSVVFFALLEGDLLT